MSTIGESISRVRNIMKAVKEDAFITDRFIYSMIIKYGKFFLKREDNKNKLMRMSSLFKKLPCIELIEVDKVEACCTGIRTGCIIKRTKDKLPEMIEGAYGPIIRGIYSLDYSQEVYKTEPETYSSIVKNTNFKYNKNKYCWYLNGYLYFPDLDWDGVLVEALFSGDTSNYTCEENPCTSKQQGILPFPEYLVAEVEQMILKEISTSMSVPSDGADDKQNPLR